MAEEKYKVEAYLEVGAKKAVSGLDAVLGKIKALQDKVKGLQFGLNGVVSRLVAVGAAYVGINAITSGVKSLALGILAANADAEAMQAALATVYSAVEKVSFKQATEDAKLLFKTLEKVAIVSTATAPELMQVFQGIYGPLRNAGLSIQQIVDTTNNAAVAASALGVDFAQASRDISAMARGTAGLDVKTFSLLQSMGLIKETTEQWNKLAPDKRAKKLMDVMGKIGGQAAEAYGRTWKGLSSTFVDIMGAFKRAFGTAVFERMKSTLEKVNKYLLENRERIEAYLRVLGERVGTIFDHVIARAASMYTNVVANIGAISARMAALFARFNELKPTIMAGMKFAGALSLASSAFSMLAPVLSALLTSISWLVGVIGSISAAGGIGAALASAGTAVSAFGAAALAAAGPIAIVVAVIVALIAGFIRFRVQLAALAAPLWETLKSIGAQFKTVFRDLWKAVKPLLEILGGAIIASVILYLRLFAWYIDKFVMPGLKLLARVVRWLVEEILIPVFKGLEPVIDVIITALGWLADKIEALVGAIGDAINWIGDKLGGIGDMALGADEIPDLESRPGRGMDDTIALMAGENPADIIARNRRLRGSEGPSVKPMDPKKAQREMEAIMEAERRKKREAEVLGKERPTVHNDFRGSKITVKQEFREADPDNVWVQFRDGLEHEAVARTRSGFADALAR